MTESDRDARLFGQQLAVEMVLKTLLDIELSKQPSDDERLRRWSDIKRAAERLVADAILEDVDPNLDTLGSARSAAGEVLDAVFGMEPVPSAS